MLLVDNELPALFPWLDRQDCIRIAAREDAKNLATVADVIERMREMGANRQSHLLAIGGGIVQDVATFVASSYMRGVDWTYCPSTLLGMVDSCIGGKSSLNVGPYKNIAGNFYPPGRVLIDTDFCATLPTVQKIEGLCEAVKICYCSQDQSFENYLAQAQTNDLLAGSSQLNEVIGLSLQTKKAFIEADEFDNGVRLLLNFGHTFGHAIEGASAYRISHGVAVGLGMLCAARFSEINEWIDANQPRMRGLVDYVRSLLIPLTQLQDALQAMTPQEAFSCFLSDKKHQKDKFVLIVFDRNGFLERRIVSSSAENMASIASVFDWIRDTLFL